MTVANRLRAAFAVYATLIVVLAVLYARAAQRSADGAHALADVAALGRAATDDLARLDQMSGDAEKYLATRDTRYRDRFELAFRGFGKFDARSLQPDVIDSLRAGVLAALAKSQSAMGKQIVASEATARRAARGAWIVAGIALTLGILVTIILVRSMVRPLDRLTQGTREVAAGRFNYRLDATGRDEFASVGREFNSMAARLAELDRLKKDFVAAVSHDLKTPLSSMQETNRALLDDLAGPLSTHQRRLITLNLESGERLGIMLGKLLDLSRIEAGLSPVLQPLDVNQVARRSVDLANQSAARRRVRLTLVTQDCRSLVDGDVVSVSQVLDNLVENAIKFSPADGEVRVSVAERPMDGEVTVTVADEGPGIPASERQRVFDRFYQTAAGRAVPQRGVGLGLTICREIVAAHGGRIWVEENTPRGSAFHVALKRSIAAAAAFLLIGAASCAASPHPSIAPQVDPRLTALTQELQAVHAQLDSTAAVADSLRLVLQRIKDIDLKPRTAPRPPQLKPQD